MMEAFVLRLDELFGGVRTRQCNGAGAPRRHGTLSNEKLDSLLLSSQGTLDSS